MQFFLPFSLVFCLAALIAVGTVPPIRKVALSLGQVDQPSARKVHHRPMVRLGGVAICAATLGALVIAGSLGWFTSLPPDSLAKIFWIMLGGLGFFLIGLADDLLSLSPFVRLLLQVMIASWVWQTGVRIDFVTIPGLGLVQLIDGISLVLTVVWLTGVVNAINWIDGLDGLASGVSGIVAIAMFIICLFMGQLGEAFVMAALAGSLLGFLYYNFNPAQIFMGDGGSYFIGFTIAGISIIGLVKSAAVFAILLPFLILAVPILDMSAVIVARLRHGCSPFTADKRHLHHRLLNAGLSHRLSVFVMYALTFWAGSLAMVLIGVPIGLFMLGSATGLLGCTTWTVWRSLRG
jgi:UDP-N-acetylmuramyl pentapeptide phosphotransferase/UDP-N-acetylglucosamine-1-phosphate transferase